MSVNTIFSVSNAVSILERALVFLNAGTQHSKPHSGPAHLEGGRSYEEL